MAIFPSYPGVYLEELPSTVRTIVGVPTAVAAFVGPAIRGPVDEAGHISSWSDFDRKYGGLSNDSLMSYAVFHYYQNGGGEAEILRVAARSAPAIIDLGGGVKLEALKPGTLGNEIVARVDHDTNDATLYKLSIKNDAQTYSIKADAAEADPNSLELQLAKSTLVKPAEGTKRGKPPASPAPGADPFAGPGLPRGKGGRDAASRATVELAAKDPEGKDRVVTLEARDPGAWGNNLVVLVDYDTADMDNKSLYNLTIRDTAPGRESEETWRNIEAVASSDRSLDRALEGSRLVRAASGTPLNWRPLKPDGGVPVKVKTKGTDGGAVLESELKGQDGARRTGMYALRDTDIFTMLCIPPLSRGSAYAADLMTAAAKLCLERRAMLLVDSPADWGDVDAAYEGFQTLLPKGDEAKNAALYFPWVRLPNANGQLQEFPPSGTVAGVWARNDGQRNVAKAPAGTEASLSGVSALATKLTDAQNGRLNPLGINCLRMFPVIGAVIWGARTLNGADRLADQWKYVPVRRTALYIEESLYRGTQWVVFEPNDEPLWSAVRLNVGAFMNSLFRQGMFQGRTPKDAYLVQCDKENNPQNDIDRGIVNILVGFAPLKPAEFVFIHIQQLNPAPQV